MSSISLTLGLRGRLLSGTQITLQGALFGNNEPGFTFEPWDITTLFQDRAGTTPVTAAGQSVGLRLDKSGCGNHEVAVSDAKRGIYGWMPKTGKRNLLTWTEQFDNAAWLRDDATISVNAITAPDGTLTADKLVENTATATHDMYALSTTQPIATFTYSLYVKTSGRTKFRFQQSSTTAYAVLFDLVAMTVTTVAGGAVGSITAVGDNWYRCSITYTTTVSFAPTLTLFLADAAGSLSYTGDGTSGVYVWGAQLEVGSTATAYQRVVSQYDITEAGVPTCYYVQADGVDDAYVTPTITPNTDKVQVFAGVQKLSDAATGIVLEASTSIGANNGSIQLAAPFSGANYTFQSRGTTQQAASYTNAAVAAPVTSVLTCIGDISADISKLRVNGVQVAENLADQGTGNYLAYPAYIYGRAGTSLPFNGLDFGHAVRFGPNLDAATIARVEALIARNTPEVTL